MPLLALPAWVFLMGLSRTEQRRLQLKKNVSVEVLRIKRRKARAEAKRALVAELLGQPRTEQQTR